MGNEIGLRHMEFYNIYTYTVLTRTGVPELRAPALVCLSAIDKTSA